MIEFIKNTIILVIYIIKSFLTIVINKVKCSEDFNIPVEDTKEVKVPADSGIKISTKPGAVNLFRNTQVTLIDILISEITREVGNRFDIRAYVEGVPERLDFIRLRISVLERYDGYNFLDTCVLLQRQKLESGSSFAYGCGLSSSYDTLGELNKQKLEKFIKEVVIRIREIKCN